MVKSIELILENCQIVVINAKFIGDFAAEDIKESVERVACNCIKKTRTCQTFRLAVHRSANVEQNEVWTMGGVDKKYFPFTRLASYPDITSVVVNYKDGNSEHIDILWGEEDCWCNSRQDTYVSDDGDLYINVGEAAKDMVVDDAIWALMKG